MKFAIIFPGQGSQSIGMMKGFETIPIVRETFSEASDVLHQDLWKLITEGPAEELNLTENTQPVMLTAGYAVYREWKNLRGDLPHVMAGHSLGEYTALVAADALAFRDAVELVRFRAKSMQEAVPKGEGAMAAILGLEDAVVKAVCEEVMKLNAGDVVEAVNFNAPGQVVIAGKAEAVKRAADLAKEKGSKRVVMLAVSGPFHSSLMRPAAEKMRERLKKISIYKPHIPVLHNFDVTSHADGEGIKQALVEQIYHPVRWVETVQAIVKSGVIHVAECGPGRVLAGLAKRIAPTITDYAWTDRAALEKTKTEIK